MDQYNAALDNGATPDQLGALYHNLGLDSVTVSATPLGQPVEVEPLPPIPGVATEDYNNQQSEFGRFLASLPASSGQLTPTIDLSGGSYAADIASYRPAGAPDGSDTIPVAGVRVAGQGYYRRTGVDLNLFARNVSYSDPLLAEAAQNIDLGGKYFTISGHGDGTYGIFDERNAHYGFAGNDSYGQPTYGEVGATTIDNAADMLFAMQDAGFKIGQGQIPFFISCELGSNSLVRGLAGIIDSPVYASNSIVTATAGTEPSSSWLGGDDETITLSSRSGFTATYPQGYNGPSLPRINSITINLSTHNTTFH